ncbi:Oidioi.mRNA.OKI2018_I69.PAR.g12138.t1.cds [Oikopleura dioica]|uniref:Oidioi.mRNA.OKI2018_I69.PAR.g12138.t1.cds n=1 Tax=Oikopleura dioica TaxID=34765 RepID=A0ABN7S2I6_OIKDI|nr:Oidioi.mRNA.OKI2018_I69.PAR.g12138.t1.cds [Oikopleura dioica]
MKLEVATLISAAAAHGNFWGHGGQHMWRGNGYFPMNNHFDFYQGNNYNQMGRFYGNDRFMDYYNRYWGNNQMRHSYNQWWPQNWFGGNNQWNMSPAYNFYGNNWMGRSFYGNDRFYDNQYSRNFYGNNNYWMNNNYRYNNQWMDQYNYQGNWMNNYRYGMSPAYNFYGNNWMGRSFYGNDRFYDNQFSRSFYGHNNYYNNNYMMNRHFDSQFFYGNNYHRFNNYYNNNWMSFGNSFYGQDSFFQMAEQFFWRNSEWNSDNADRVLRSWQGKWDQSMFHSFEMCGNGQYVDYQMMVNCHWTSDSHMNMDFFSHFAPRYISMHFQYFDMNRDGRLNPEEFRRAWAGFFSTVGSTIVDMFDRDHNDMIDSYEMHDFQYYMNYFYPSSFQHSQMSRFFNNHMYSFSKWDMTEFALQNTNRWW